MGSMFLAWFKANQQYEEGRNLTYAEFPSKFTYFEEDRMWQPRKSGYSIGRLAYVPVGAGELYYLRILLTLQRGCTSYESVRTVKGVVCHSFQDACYALYLLQNDKEFIDAIIETSHLGSGFEMRALFVRLLIMGTMTKLVEVWNASWRLLSEGIIYHRRKALNMPGISMNIFNFLTLINIYKLIHNINLYTYIM
jgi:hypothetical protein